MVLSLDEAMQRGLRNNLGIILQSSAQKNAMDKWIKDYTTQCSGASIDYQGTGSGAGIQAFTAQG